VVTSTVGSRWFCAARSPDEVSPLRAPAVQAKRPSADKASSGSCNARSVSAASARIGVIHSTVSGGGFFVAAAANAINAPSHTA